MIADIGEETPAMRSLWALLFVLTHIAGFSGAASAQTLEQQAAWCNAPNPELSISGCTVVIQSGRLTQGGLALVFRSRGNAYDRKGEYDRAIQDYDQAIRLVPNYARAIYSRGLAHANKRDYDRAIQDYDQVIRLAPNSANAFNNRGIAYRALGRPARAAEDFAKARQLNPNLPPSPQ